MPNSKRRAFSSGAGMPNPPVLIGATLALLLSFGRPLLIPTAVFAESSTAGDSWWGPVPAPSDSNSATFKSRGMPAWEGAVVWPWRVVTFPVRAVWSGAGAGLSYSDEHRLIYRASQLLNPPDVPYGLMPNFSSGGLTGVGGGIGFYHNSFFGESNRFRLSTQYSSTSSSKAVLGIQIARGKSNSFEIGAGYRLRRNARFFGTGPESNEENESFYTQELAWGGITYRRKVKGRLDLGVSGLYSTAGARGPREQNEPSLGEQFDGALPAGYGVRSDGPSFGIELHHENLAETGRPESGGLRRAKAVYFSESGDGSASFWTYRGEVQQFLPLWFSRRALALRGVMSWIDPTGGSVVPFQRLMTNDDPDQIRGYKDFRWTDRGLVLASVEYRWPMWAIRHAEGAGLDAYVLADWGQVFGDVQDISLNHVTESYGGGLRLLSSGGFLFRVEYARSSEESVLRFAASQNFQFSRNGLFYGRNPVPER